MRPYIYFADHTLSQYMVEPRCIHFITINHVLRYLRGTIDYGLQYVVDCGYVILLLYVDDMFLIGEVKLIFDSKKKLAVEFEMKDL